MAAAAAVAVVADTVLPNSPSDTISSLHFAPQSGGPGGADYLCASGWDCSVSVWEVGAAGDAASCIPRAQSAHAAPVLCTAWSGSGESMGVLSGGCDSSVRLWQVASNQTLEIGRHDAPVRQVFDLSASGSPAPSVASLSWDKTCRYWDARSSVNGAPAALTVNLSDKVYAADVRGVVMVVACAERHVQIFDLRRPDAPVRTMPSPLKFQSRSVALFPDQTGFALGSIEGRVAIQYINEPPQPAQPAAPGAEPQPDLRNFAFKCHRQGNETYPVNDISFHPNGTFVTVGGDGIYTFWDKDTKQRLKLSAAQGNNLTCAAFNPAGSLLAYGVGYDGSKGEAGDKTRPTHVALHKLTDADIGRRPKA